MQALVLEEPGSPPRLSLREVPTPQPGPGEALVQVAACGLCYHDILVMQGKLRRGVKQGIVLGHEISGRVVAVGPEVSRVGVGDPVATLLTEACGACARCAAGREHRCLQGHGIGHGRDGGFAQFVCVQETALVPLPPSLDLPSACVAVCPLGVAVEALQRRAGLQPGETVVVTGAGGGLGMHAVQVALAGGARVLAVTASPQKAQALEELGAEVVLAEEGLDFGEVVQALTDDQGADVVVNVVGSAAHPSCWTSLAQYGRLLVVGEVSGGQMALSPAELLFKDALIMGVSGASRAAAETAVGLLADGRVRPWVSRYYPLEEVLDAYHAIVGRATLGRVALIPPG